MALKDAVTKKRKVLKPVRPNIGLEVEYRRCLLKLVDDMNASILYWISAAFKANAPEIALDALPSGELNSRLAKLGRRWKRRWNRSAAPISGQFAQKVGKNTDRQVQNALGDAGFGVKFKMTRAMRDVLNSTVNANVSLIKSIPQQYLTDIEGAVMRSVQSGRDLQSLTKAIRKTHSVSRRRAAFIAKDQNNKATSALTKARWQEMGLRRAIWRHSHAGEVPRHTHLRNDGKPYDIKKGWYDPAVKRWIQPGEEPGCRCTGQPIIEGFS